MRQSSGNNSNVGTFAVTTFDFNHWKPTQPPANVKQRKTRSKKVVVHNIFEKCLEHITDPFWIEKITAASYNKFPRGFGYRDGVLFYKKGNKSQSLEIGNKNYFEAANATIEFMRTNGGIFSTLDKEKSTLMHSNRDAEYEEEELTWANTNKRVHECLISNYVVFMKQQMGLTDNEKEHLRQTVNLGISNKFFTKDNIHITDKQIYLIDGLLWDDESRRFYIDPDLKPAAVRTYTRKRDAGQSLICEKETIPQFHSKWTKYIQSLHSKVSSNVSTVVISDDELSEELSPEFGDTPQSMSLDI